VPLTPPTPPQLGAGSLVYYDHNSTREPLRPAVIRAPPSKPNAAAPAFQPGARETSAPSSAAFSVDAANTSPYTPAPPPTRSTPAPPQHGDHRVQLQSSSPPPQDNQQRDVTGAGAGSGSGSNSNIGGNNGNDTAAPTAIPGTAVIPAATPHDPHQQLEVVYVPADVLELVVGAGSANVAYFERLSGASIYVYERDPPGGASSVPLGGYPPDVFLSELAAVSEGMRRIGLMGSEEQTAVGADMIRRLVDMHLQTGAGAEAGVGVGTVAEAEAGAEAEAEAEAGAGLDAASASAEITCVFVRDIPASADEASIEAVFQRFGAITGVVIRAQKNPSTERYAFVEYADPSGAAAAIEARVEIEGKALFVEEKRDMSHGGGVRSEGGGGSGGLCGERRRRGGSAGAGALFETMRYQVCCTAPPGHCLIGLFRGNTLLARCSGHGAAVEASIVFTCQDRAMHVVHMLLAQTVPSATYPTSAPLVTEREAALYLRKLHFSLADLCLGVDVQVLFQNKP
jgi:hypothetical protein